MALRTLGASSSIAALTDGWGDEGLWNRSGLDVQLCDNRVVAITQSLPGGFHEFSRLVKQEAEVRGTPSLNALNGLSEAGENSTLAAEWHSGGEVFRLTLWVQNSDEPRISKQVHWNRYCNAQTE